MARAGFKDHPKFKRLVYLLKEPVPHVWGYLECLWNTAYQLRDDKIGDSISVELNAEYPGETGKLCNALLNCGWIDEIEGQFYIHDLLDHCPPYVKKLILKRNSTRPIVDQKPEKVPIDSTSAQQDKEEDKDKDKEEEKEKEEIPPLESPPEQRPTDSDASWVFRTWLAFLRRAPNKHDAPAFFDELMRQGYFARSLIDAIQSKDRDRTQATWDFAKWLKTRPPPVTTARDRKAMDDKLRKQDFDIEKAIS